MYYSDCLCLHSDHLWSIFQNLMQSGDYILGSKVSLEINFYFELRYMRV